MANDVYLLDLCVLAYQLHSQTLYWPLDPYGEQMRFKSVSWSIVDTNWKRNAFLNGVKLKLAEKPPKLLDPRGPGFVIGKPVTGWKDNPKLDPIIYRYDTINPHAIGYTRQNKDDDGVLLYMTPLSITRPIKDSFMVQYKRGAGPNGAAPQVEVVKLDAPEEDAPDPPLMDDPNGGGLLGTARLCCFEGATGVDRDGAGSWSMMGYVLRVGGPADYELYIVFRGSRSGEMLFRASGYYGGKGNPDWVTNLGWGHDGVTGRYERVPEVAPVPMHRGFARSVKSMMKTIFRALKEATAGINRPPTAITVTGHSLGGGLASSFVSAILIGNTYRPEVANTLMPEDLKKWRWEDMKLVTFGAPAVGGGAFSAAFNVRSRASKNIYLRADPVPTQTGGTHHSFAVPLASMGDTIDFAEHAPDRIRTALVNLFEWFDMTASNAYPAYPRAAPVRRPEAARGGWFSVATKLAPDLLCALDVPQALAPLILYLECVIEGKTQGVIEVTSSDVALLTGLIDALKALREANEDSAKELYKKYFDKMKFVTDSSRAMYRMWLGLVVLEQQRQPKPQAKLSNDFLQWIAASP